MSAQAIDTVTATDVVIPTAQVRDALSACMLSADRSKYSTLPILAAVKVERNGREVTFTSTDRYRLTRVTVTTDDETQGEWAIVVSTADVKRILTLAPRTARGFMALTFTMDGDTLTVTDHDGSSVKVTAVDGEYPRLGGVITPMMDDPKPVESCGFNPKFLADLGKMPGLSHNAALRISFHGDNKPVSVTWSDGQLDYFHILMPVRIA